MTANERAKKLVDRYLKIEWTESLSLGDAGWSDIKLSIPIEEAKRCALITVDEMIMLNKKFEWGSQKTRWWIEENDAYWRSVKDEINNL